MHHLEDSALQSRMALHSRAFTMMPSVSQGSDPERICPRVQSALYCALLICALGLKKSFQKGTPVQAAASAWQLYILTQLWRAILLHLLDSSCSNRMRSTALSLCFFVS